MKDTLKGGLTMAEAKLEREQAKHKESERKRQTLIAEAEEKYWREKQVRLELAQTKHEVLKEIRFELALVKQVKQEELGKTSFEQDRLRMLELEKISILSLTKK